MTTQSNTAELTHKRLDRAFLSGDFQKFDELLGDLTPRKLAVYEATSTKEKDIVFYLWCHHVSWAYESCWANWVLMTPEEQARLQAEHPDYDQSPPENFEIDRPLKEVGRWHISDVASNRGFMT
jgi:hypothetical protein